MVLAAHRDARAAVVQPAGRRQHGGGGGARALAHLGRQPLVVGERDELVRHVHEQQVHVLVERLEQPRAGAAHRVDAPHDHEHALVLQEAAPQQRERPVQVRVWVGSARASVSQSTSAMS